MKNVAQIVANKEKAEYIDRFNKEKATRTLTKVVQAAI